MHTLMGYVCQGRLLHSNHLFFVDRNADAGGAVKTSAGGQGIGATLKEAEEGDEEKEEEMDFEDEWDSINQR